MSLKGFYSAILLLFAATTLLTAQTQELQKANGLYKQGDFQGAAMMYEDIAKTYGVAPELYYNTGNAYYKAGEIGRSILFYERALRLAPNYEDARANLDLAQTKVVDNIVQVPPFFVKRWIDLLIKSLGVDNWYVLSVVTFILTLCCLLFFVFGNSISMRKIAFYSAFVLFFAAALSVTFALVRRGQLTNHTEAIIMSGTVTIKSSPDKSGTDLFQLHEGTKVVIKSKLGNWTEIKLGNGNIGWLESNNIEEI